MGHDDKIVYMKYIKPKKQKVMLLFPKEKNDKAPYHAYAQKPTQTALET